MRLAPGRPKLPRRLRRRLEVTQPWFAEAHRTSRGLQPDRRVHPSPLRRWPATDSPDGSGEASPARNIAGAADESGPAGGRLLAGIEHLAQASAGVGNLHDRNAAGEWTGFGYGDPLLRGLRFARRAAVP